MDLLQGLRVLTLEHFGAAPYGTQLLADLGAEVVKVEHGGAGGDASRSVGPYYLGDSDSQYFQSFSRGKKSVDIDLKTAAGRARFERLASGADALVHNLRGDQPAKLRLRHADLEAVNPALVCAHISAYGRDNERAAWPGFDYLMQAECGFLSLTGEPGTPPARFGLSMVDFMTGAIMSTTLLAAVMKSRRTGKGADVDCCLYDTALHQLSYPATWYLNEGLVTKRLNRSSHPSAVPSQLLKSADGWLFVMCQTDKFWALFCDIIERPELLADPRFADMASRLANVQALQDEVEATLTKAPSAHWVAKLAGSVPVAPVYDIAEALDNPFAAAVGMLNTVAHPDREQGLRMLSSPFKVNGERAADRRAPKLGEHDAEFP